MPERAIESSKPIRWYQFTLRRLFIAGVVFAVLFGWLRPWKARTWEGPSTMGKAGGLVLEPLVWPQRLEVVYEVDRKGKVVCRLVQLDGGCVWWQAAKYDKGPRK